MAHIREEGALRFVGAVRVSKRFFEERLLLELFADLLIDIAQTHYDEVLFAGAHSRNAELAILECIVHIGAIDAVEAIVRGKFATNVLGGEQGADHLLVFSINALVDVGIHRLIERDVSCKDVAQCCIEVFRYLEHFARIGIELE